VLIESRPPLDPELAALVTAQMRETRELGQLVDTAVFAPCDDAVYLAGVVDGRVVACGGWQPAGDGIAELKRMYVRPAFRGRGIARQMIVAIEEDALAAGRSVIRVETGAPAAIALYQSSGYRETDAGDPATVCFEKRLAALV
jgi:putative acetyltransferase